MILLHDTWPCHCGHPHSILKVLCTSSGQWKLWSIITALMLLIDGGLYLKTAMRKAKSKNTVYSTKHQGLKRANQQTKSEM